MSNRKYIFTWPNYYDHLKQMLQTMKDDESSQDVTLVCDDKTKIKAHQIVLKTCSSLFESMFEGLSQPNPIVFLRGIQHQELESVLQFMYLGEATFYQERMNEFLNVAKNLEVKELSKDIEFNEEDDATGQEDVIDSHTPHTKFLQGENPIDESLTVKVNDATTTIGHQLFPEISKIKFSIAFWASLGPYKMENVQKLRPYLKEILSANGLKRTSKAVDLTISNSKSSILRLSFSSLKFG